MNRADMGRSVLRRYKGMALRQVVRRLGEMGLSCQAESW